MNHIKSNGRVQQSTDDHFNNYACGSISHRSILVMEVFSNSECPKNCPRCDRFPVRKRFPDYQFTPEMAIHLAEKLNEYDCVIENLQFIGGEPLLWKHFEKCIDILRMTEKIMSIKMFTALIDGIDMRPFESVFDVIGVTDYGTNRHLIERYALDNPMYVVFRTEKHDYHPRGRLPGTIPCDCGNINSWLFDKRVHFCSIAGPILMSNLDLKMSASEIDSYSWTLDDFLQNIEKCQSEFGSRNICEACHVNPNVKRIVGAAKVNVPGWFGDGIYEIR